MGGFLFFTYFHKLENWWQNPALIKGRKGLKNSPLVWEMFSCGGIFILWLADVHQERIYACVLQGTKQKKCHNVLWKNVTGEFSLPLNDRKLEIAWKGMILICVAVEKKKRKVHFVLWMEHQIIETRIASHFPSIWLQLAQSLIA